MIMKTLTISRLLERILRKEFHQLRDFVKKKTKAVENYRPLRHCRIGFKSKSVMFSVLTCYDIQLKIILCILFDWNSVSVSISWTRVFCIFCEGER